MAHQSDRGHGTPARLTPREMTVLAGLEHELRSDGRLRRAARRHAASAEGRPRTSPWFRRSSLGLVVTGAALLAAGLATVPALAAAGAALAALGLAGVTAWLGRDGVLRRLGRRIGLARPARLRRRGHDEPRRRDGGL